MQISSHSLGCPYVVGAPASVHQRATLCSPLSSIRRRSAFGWLRTGRTPGPRMFNHLPHGGCGERSLADCVEGLLDPLQGDGLFRRARHPSRRVATVVIASSASVVESRSRSACRPRARYRLVVPPTTAMRYQPCTLGTAIPSVVRAMQHQPRKLVRHSHAPAARMMKPQPIIGKSIPDSRSNYACSDIASRGYQHVDGAVRQGETAALAVLAALE